MQMTERFLRLNSAQQDVAQEFLLGSDNAAKFSASFHPKQEDHACKARGPHGPLGQVTKPISLENDQRHILSCELAE